MNRRDFLFSVSAATALTSFGRLSAQTAGPAPTPPPVPAAAPAAPPIKPVFTPLRRNVGHFTARGGTIGWLASPEALAVVDTQFPNTAELCLAGLPERSQRPLDVVINTHHHGDHTGGNSVFKPVAKHIVAHANVPDLQRRAAERARPPTVDQQVYADQTFSETWSLPLGDEVVSARYFGPAHTKGDIAVHFEKANVVHLGDLMFNRIFPVIDRPGGASIRGWIEVLEKLPGHYSADTTYIFGHGSEKFGVTGRREDLAVLRDYLSALLDHVQKQISAGQTKEQIVVLKEFPGFPDFNQPGSLSRLPSNLGTAYDELTEKTATS